MKIDKNLPIPRRGKKRPRKYMHHFVVLKSWEVGDSVAFKAESKQTGKDKRPNYSREGTVFTNRAKKFGQKVIQRVIHDEGVLRVWRAE
jgi:ribosomal protein L21E